VVAVERERWGEWKEESRLLQTTIVLIAIASTLEEPKSFGTLFSRYRHTRHGRQELRSILHN